MRENGCVRQTSSVVGGAKQALLSVVFSGKRQVSLELARKLAGFFKVSVEVFI